jgi:hypothetical protein
MMSIQKSPNDKTGLRYVASSSDGPSTSKTVFVKPTVPELPPAVEDKQKEKVNDDVPGIQQPHSIRRPPICHHCGLNGHVRPQFSLLKAQKDKAKKEAQTSSLWRKTYGSAPDSLASCILSSTMGTRIKASVSSPLVSCSSASVASAAVRTSQLQWHLQEQTQEFENASRAILQ